MDVVINLTNMTIKVTIEKKNMKACKTLQAQSNPTTCEVAQVRGLLVSSFNAVMFGRLNYREIERENPLPLKSVMVNMIHI